MFQESLLKPIIESMREGLKADAAKEFKMQRVTNIGKTATALLVASVSSGDLDVNMPTKDDAEYRAQSVTTAIEWATELEDQLNVMRFGHANPFDKLGLSEEAKKPGAIKPRPNGGEYGPVQMVPDIRVAPIPADREDLLRTQAQDFISRGRSHYRNEVETERPKDQGLVLGDYVHFYDKEKDDAQGAIVLNMETCNGVIFADLAVAKQGAIEHQEAVPYASAVIENRPRTFFQTKWPALGLKSAPVSRYPQVGDNVSIFTDHPNEPGSLLQQRGIVTGTDGNVLTVAARCDEFPFVEFYYNIVHHSSRNVTNFWKWPERVNG